MKEKELLELMGEINDKHIEESLTEMKKPRSLLRKLTVAGVTVAACAVLAVSAVFAGGYLTEHGFVKHGDILPLDSEIAEETKASPGTGYYPDKGDPNHRQDGPYSAYDPSTDSPGVMYDENIGWMIPYGCFAHHESYHSYPSTLTEYVGNEEFDLWYYGGKTERSDDTTVCGFPERNIKAFIDHFQIPRDVFERLCGTNAHDIDLLYSDDLEAIDAYYRDFKAFVFSDRRFP